MRDYRNHFKPEPGFVLENIQGLQSIVKSYEGAAKYVVLVFDEMKIKGKLVFDKHSGNLIGLTSLGDLDLEELDTFEELEVASHVLAFVVRGVQYSLDTMTESSRFKGMLDFSRWNVGARRQQGEARWATIRDELLLKKKKERNISYIIIFYYSIYNL